MIPISYTSVMIGITLLWIMIRGAVCKKTGIFNWKREAQLILQLQGLITFLIHPIVSFVTITIVIFITCILYAFPLRFAICFITIILQKIYFRPAGE